MFEWSDSFSVGVRSVDAQHQQLFAIARELHVSMASGQGGDSTGRILGRLVDYTIVHFRNEEGLLRQHNYPDLAAHKLEHAAFEEKISQFVIEVKQGRITVNIGLLQFLRAWLEGHIKGTDMRYSQHIIKNAV